VSRFVPKATVQVWQGPRTLHTQAFRHLLPNETMHLRDDWLARVDLRGEPLRLVVAE